MAATAAVVPVAAAVFVVEELDSELTELLALFLASLLLFPIRASEKSSFLDPDE